VTVYSVVAKPIGAVCNLACDYCFYLTKTELYPDTRDFRMTDHTLEEFIRQYIASQPGPYVHFAWQGGEPTLLGMDFFAKVTELQKQYLPQGWQAENAVQTNGTLLDDAWCRFFSEHRFLVGLSLDGPPHFHDHFRKGRRGEPTCEQVVSGLRLLQKHRVDYNILCTVNAANVHAPVEVYQFFRELGARFIQFIPIVEFTAGGRLREESITGREYGKFLTAVFDQWLLNDVGHVSIQILEECFAAWSGLPGRLCIFSEECGRALALEHNGDVYLCDHFVGPEYRIGSIHSQDLGILAQDRRVQDFGREKWAGLAKQCRGCPVMFICRGGCPKNRINGLNVLCEGYRQFFGYIDPFMRLLVQLRHDQAPLDDVQFRLRRQYISIWSQTGRNDPCPCGSGLKYKKCCLGRFEGEVVK
jgi:uncharacterized protein